MTRSLPFVLVLVALSQFLAANLGAADLPLRDQELPTRLDVGYAVRLLDMNGDERLDIAIVDSKRFLWLENPNWQEHVMFEDKAAKRDNVCFAPYDIDGDGDLDFAVGRDWQPSNTASGGSIGWLQNPKSSGQPWAYHTIAEEPTTHRMQFVDIDADGRAELIVAPLLGRNTKGPNFESAGCRQMAFAIATDPKQTWTMKVLNDDMHVTHNFWPLNWDHDSAPEMLFVSFEGVHLLDLGRDGKWQRTRIGAGDQQSSPNRGASEIKSGRLANGGRYIATIEPWHGDKVVVYTEPAAGAAPADGLWIRNVLDADLKWGHAVSCANLDADADEELIIGVRDDLDAKDPQKRRGVRIYDPGAGGKWDRQIVDPGSVAIEDLAAGDLNGDKRIDIVAVGRATHNVKIYWNESK